MDELDSCMDAIKEVAEQNNERIRVTESKALLYDLQKRFSPKLTLVGPNIPSRLLIKEAPMKKVHGRGGAQVDCERSRHKRRSKTQTRGLFEEKENAR